MGVSKKDTIIACSRCILDTIDDANLILDEQGVCNHCHYYDSQKTLLVREGQEASVLLEKTLTKIKALYALFFDKKYIIAPIFIFV